MTFFFRTRTPVFFKRFLINTSFYSKILTLLYILPFSLLSQETPLQTQDGEGVIPLQVNTALFVKNKNHNIQKNPANVIYVIDTLALPFIDDFSTDKTKLNPSAIDTIMKSKFTADGQALDSLVAVNSPTYNYFYNMGTQQYDSVEMKNIIVYYKNTDPLKPDYTAPTDTDTVWHKTTYRFNEFTIDTLIHTPDTTIVNVFDTVIIVYSDAKSLWLDSTVFVNRGFAVNPPTIGVATFDGLDESGVAYDFSTPYPYGPADFLTSKPIDLSGLTPDSSVVFSFYYQPMGLGDFPELQDSLALEFFADSTWYWVWSSPGLTTAQAQTYQPVFQRIALQLSHPKYFYKGFKFRFRNYSTLSGMFDIWNVDYVYLDKDRVLNDNSVSDLGFVSAGNSYINTYTSMPMTSYKDNAAQFMVQNFPVRIANLSGNTVNNDTNRYLVYDEFETIEYKTSVNIPQTFAPFSQQTINHSVLSSPNNFLFVPSTNERTVFKIKSFANQDAADINLYNDTIIHYQVFDSYFSYDDGTAEGCYYLNEPGVYLATRFNTLFPDSLRAIELYFPYFLNDVTQYGFKLMVWANDNGKPGTVLYEGGFENPVYSTSGNAFTRYEISPTLVSGIFYIGWRQMTQVTGEKIFLGMDKNINNQSKIFHTLSGSWENTSIPGTLMMRPEFGEKEPSAYVTDVSKQEDDLHIYPNPARDIIYVGNRLYSNTSGRLNYRLKIFNAVGQLVYSRFIDNSESASEINIASIPNGFYFLTVESEDQIVFKTEKLLINR